MSADGEKPTARASASRANGALGGRPRKERRVGIYESVGAPPQDPLLGVDWAQRMLLVAMREASIDPDVTERERRAELRATAGAIARLTPYERIARAEELIRSDLQGKKQDRAEVPLVPVEADPGTLVSGRPPRGRRG